MGAKFPNVSTQQQELAVTKHIAHCCCCCFSHKQCVCVRATAIIITSTIKYACAILELPCQFACMAENSNGGNNNNCDKSPKLLLVTLDHAENLKSK